jgi:stress-induced morphogen
MPIEVAELEAAIRKAIPSATVVEIEDQSSGCGESFSVLLVSEASLFSSLCVPRAPIRPSTSASHRQSSFLTGTHTGVSREDHVGEAQNGSVQGGIVLSRCGWLILMIIVNDLLKFYIQRLHAFSQVNSLSFFGPFRLFLLLTHVPFH